MLKNVKKRQKRERNNERNRKQAQEGNSRVRLEMKSLEM